MNYWIGMLCIKMGNLGQNYKRKDKFGQKRKNGIMEEWNGGILAMDLQKNGIS